MDNTGKQSQQPDHSQQTQRQRHHDNHGGLNQGRQLSTEGTDPPLPSGEQQNDENVLQSTKDQHIIPAPRWVDRSVHNIKYGQSPRYIPSRSNRNQQLNLARNTNSRPTYNHSDSGFRKSRQSVRGLYGNRYQGGQSGTNPETVGKRKTEKVLKKAAHPKRHRVHSRRRSRGRLPSYSRPGAADPSQARPVIAVHNQPAGSGGALGGAGVLGGGAGGARRQYPHPNQFQNGGYLDRQHTYGNHPQVNRLVPSRYQQAVSLSNKPYRYDNTIARTSAHLRSSVYAPPDGTYSWRISGFSECSTTCGGGTYLKYINLLLIEFIYQLVFHVSFSGMLKHYCQWLYWLQNYDFEK